uniref:NBS-LRR type disease resistance protein n=1 Tax=Arachis hypogaea TaxID=3818 RepID=G0Y6V1_ARAHY|nr:NBS-LRR type disease resistance protein [Arachis hypogaea]
MTVRRFKDGEMRYLKLLLILVGAQKIKKTFCETNKNYHSLNRDEAVLVENIAQHIHEILIPKLSSSMKNLVGIDSRVERVISQIGLGLNDVRYIGLLGMGGIGKTTIARAVFETVRSRFEVTCFLADVREQCEKKDIVRIQKQLLDQVNINSNAVHNKYDGRTIIQNSLRLKKVLLVLDDVNHEKQLENLAGEQDWFGPGSRIIITTRDVEVLKEQAVLETYMVEGLVESEAFNLFCLKAFKQAAEPTEGFLDLSEEVVKYSGGLPLALKVLGSYLNGRPIAVWHSAIEKIKKSSHSEIIDVLKISYDGLDSMEKDIFLDIACFFKGHPQDYNLQMMLVSVADCGVTRMLILYLLKRRKLKQLIASFYMICTVLHWTDCPMETLPFRDHQRYELVEIDLSHSKIVQLWDGKKVLKKLVHLNLSYCKELKEMPDLSGAPNLKTLDLDGCEELNYFHPSLAHHKSLVELNLRGCERLETLGDKLEMSSLERLDLECCSSLRRLPEFGKCMKQLSILILKRTGIEELPTTLGNLAGMSELDLTGCYKLTSLPFPLGCFVGLKKLRLSRLVELSCVPYSTHGLESLTVKDYSGSPNIVGLLCSLSHLTSLSSLKLQGCFSTSREESTDFGRLASLTDLDLSENNFLRVPISIHELPRLTRLKLNNCRRLKVLPELPLSLRELQARDCDSLDASNANDVILKACCGFAESASQDREDLFQMWFSRKKIPAWFEHHEEGNGVSVSFSHNCPSTETIALALCFLLQGFLFSSEKPSVICNGKEFINKSLLKASSGISSENVYIVYVNGYYLSKLLCQHNCFQMLFPGTPSINIQVRRSSARWQQHKRFGKHDKTDSDSLQSEGENLHAIEAIKLIGIGLNDVCFVGIWGMGGIGVLLVLDDVNEVNCLENLGENQDWFGPGSRIIITARDMHLLDMHGVHGTCGSATHDESLYELAGGTGIVLKLIESALAEHVRFLLRSGREYDQTSSDSDKLSPRFLGCFLFRSSERRQLLDKSYLMSGKELSKLVAFVKGTQFDLVLQMETLQSRLDADFLLAHMCSVKFKEWIVVLATLLRRSEVLFDLFPHDVRLWKAYSTTLQSHLKFVEYQDLLEDLEHKLSSISNKEE